MKKIILGLLLAATVNVFAVETARVELEIRGTDNKGSKLTLIIDDEATSAAEGSAEINFTNRPVALFATYGGYQYQIFKTNSLENLNLGYKTNSGTSYTLKVLSASGETQYLQFGDDDPWALEVNSTKEITLDANHQPTDPIGAAMTMKIVAAPVAVVPEICHRYGKLEVRGTAGQTVQVLNLDGTATSIADQVMATDNETINLSGLDAGKQYLVKWNGKELIIQQ